MSDRDFDLRILKAGSHYLVDARSPDGEEANCTFELPVSPERLDELFRGLGHSRKATRGGGSPEVRQAREFGRQLFQTVFAGDIRDVFQRSLGRGGDLRIRLRLTRDVPELLDLPWELLFDRGRNRFLALEPATTLVRHLPVQQRIEPMRVAPPLRILGAISNPGQAGYPALDVEQEWGNLDQALRPLADRGLVSLTRLDGVTQDSLRQALKRDTSHVLHFIGHGAYQPTAEAGFLVLEDGRGGARPCSATRLTDLLREQPALRLVVLNACEGGRSSRTDPFAGVAQSLVQGAIPAVVAMQFPVTDAAAVVFAGAFYGGLAAGRPVDLAVAVARREVNLRGEEGEIEWATPVLYMRGDGDLFSFDERKPAQTGPTKGVLPTPDPSPEIAAESTARAGQKKIPEPPEPLQVKLGKETAPPHQPETPPKKPLPKYLAIALGAAVVGLAVIFVATRGPMPVPAPTAETAPTPAPARAPAAPEEVTAENAEFAARIIERLRDMSRPINRNIDEARKVLINGPKPLYAGYQTGDVFQECEHCPEMVAIIPDRPFTIGSPGGEQSRTGNETQFGPINFARPYALGRYEVTRAQFEQSGVTPEAGCLTASSSAMGASANWKEPGFDQDDRHPVVCVSWNDVGQYLKWLNASLGLVKYRLPTEAEWEYAARGNNYPAEQYPRFWGKNPDEACTYANVADVSFKYDVADRSLKDKFADWTIFRCKDNLIFTAPVGSFKANPFGLSDMLGNAWEWMQDCYVGKYDGSIRDGRAYEASGNCESRVLRGGSWFDFAGNVRSAFRRADAPSYRGFSTGFRVARTLP